MCHLGVHSMWVVTAQSLSIVLFCIWRLNVHFTLRIATSFCKHCYNMNLIAIFRLYCQKLILHNYEVKISPQKYTFVESTDGVHTILLLSIVLTIRFIMPKKNSHPFWGQNVNRIVMSVDLQFLNSDFLFFMGMRLAVMSNFK